MNKTMKKHFARVKDGAGYTLGTDEIMWENEVKANKMVNTVNLLLLVMIVTSLVLTELGVFVSPKHSFHIVSAVIALLLASSFIGCFAVKGRKKYLKITMLLTLILALTIEAASQTYNVHLLIILPVIISSRYYNRAFTVFVSVVTAIDFAIAAYVGCFLGKVDLNFVELKTEGSVSLIDGLKEGVIALGYDQSLYISETMIRGFIPKLMIFIVVSVIAAEIAHKGRMLVEEQYMVAKENSRIDTELNLAREIQEKALPIVHEMEDHPSFDLAASMTPAKEVGGDFYDMVFLDETHVALIIADVSGKGVPAAMMMMVSKLLLDIGLTGTKGPGDILTEVNHQLAEKNLENMFVTAWLGILDLETGNVVSANAGHEYPIIRRKGGKAEIFKDKHGLVLGAMDGIRYKETNFNLEPGDVLFVYTDGVTEANNEAGEFFGMERTCHAVDKAETESMEDMIRNMKEEISDFSGEAPQFDDITMMSLKINEYMSGTGMTANAVKENMEMIMGYLEAEMEKAEIPFKQLSKMNIAIDEILSNIVHHSHAVWVRSEINITDDDITVSFIDNGIPYDPLQKKDPDISLSVEEREIGGLGIFMTRKLMDEVNYSYEHGCNRLELKLRR